MRKHPSVSSKKVSYCEDMPCDKMSHVIPRGTTVEMLTRTPQKDTVMKWNNYCNYIKYKPEGDIVKAWAFSELIKLEH